jgi:hypothetical protein
VFKLNRPDGATHMDAMLRRIERQTGQIPVLVIIDTLREGLSGSVSKEEDVSPFLDAAGKIARKGPAVVLVAHISQDAARNQKLEDRTPKGLTDFCDRAAWVVLKEANVAQGTAALFALKVKNGPARWRLDLTVRPGLRGIPVQALAEKQGPGTPRAKHDPHGTDQAGLDLIDRAVASLLAQNPSKPWTHRELAEALACREEIVLSGASLEKRQLKTIRETTGTETNRCYDSMQRRYHWQSAKVVALATPRQSRFTRGTSTMNAKDKRSSNGGPIT